MAEPTTVPQDDVTDTALDTLADDGCPNVEDR